MGRDQDARPAEPSARETQRAFDALIRGVRAPSPTLQFRRRAWLAFQRAIDPLAPPKPLPRRRSSNG